MNPVFFVRLDWNTLFQLYLLVVNLAAFALMGLDKRRAQRGQWRIPEHTLFLFPFVGGALGGILGMSWFHHKTRHWYFVWGFRLLLVAQLLGGLWVRWKGWG